MSSTAMRFSTDRALRGCERKQVFTSPAKARKRVREMGETRAVEVYRCQTCSLYHLTTKRSTG